jgi:virginiamycin B lyase
MRLIFLTAFVLVSASPEFAQTAPPQAVGYHLMFSEDFSHFDLSSSGYGQHVWYPGVYFQLQLPLPGEVTVNNSALGLEWQSNSGNTNTSIESCAYDASHCDTFRYGYFEARMRWDVTTGSWPAFWMITKQSIEGVQHVGELDIFEGQGNEPAHYYGTINEWNGAHLVTTNSPVKNVYPVPAGTDFSQWHDYGLLWVPGRVTWYFDDQAIGTAATPSIFDQQDFFIILGSQEGNNWTAGNLTGVTAQSINLNVESVHVFQSSAVPSEASVAPVVQSPALTLLTAAFPVPNTSLPYAVEPQVIGGTVPYTFAIAPGSLPGGLQLDPGSGAITTIPGAVITAGAYSFTLKVTDATKAVATQTYSGTVSAAPLVQNFSSYALPRSSGANGIVAGPDGNLWFTTSDQTGGNLIGRITTTGSVTLMSAPSALTKSPNAAGGDITAGLDGSIWVAERDGSASEKLAIDLSSQTSYALAPSAAGPAQIAPAADGSVWFTEPGASQIGHLDAAGKVTEFPTPTPLSAPSGIAIARNNYIVYTELGANKIGYMSPDGSTNVEFPIPTRYSLPTSIVVGPDDAFWFTESGANHIGRMDSSGHIQEVAVSSAPRAITVGPDGALYFTETAANKIGRITIFGAVNEIAIPDANSGPDGIATGPDGAMWFTESNLSKIGRLSFVPAPVVNCVFPQAPSVYSTFTGSCAGSGGTAPYTFGATGNRPPGLSLNPNTGAVSGTPSQAGTFAVTVLVKDSSLPAQVGQQTYTITVTPRRPSNTLR